MHFGLISGAIVLDLLTLFACVILGENRLKDFVTAAFVFSISTVAQVPVIYLFFFSGSTFITFAILGRSICSDSTASLLWCFYY